MRSIVKKTGVFLALAVLITAAFILSGVAANPATILDNYFSDLDINGRFTEYYVEIKKGTFPFMSVNALDALYDDVKTIDLDDAGASEIIVHTMNAVQGLRNASKLAQDGAHDAACKLADSAYETMNKALSLKRQYMMDNGV